MQHLAETFLAMAVVAGAASAGQQIVVSDRDLMPAFTQIDQDEDGSISKEEATAMLGLTSEFTQADRNEDGQLSEQEYDMVLLRWEGKMSTQVLSRR